MRRTLFSLTLAFAPASFAFTSTASDAPTVDSAAPAPAPEPSTRSALPTPAAPSTVHVGAQLGVGAAAALVSVPVSLYFGALVGNVSNDLVGSALPTLLSIGLIPPLAISLACWVAGNWRAEGLYRLWPALLADLAINAVSLAVGQYLGLTTLFPGRVLLYALAQAVLQPAAATALMRAWPKYAPSTLASHDPNTSATFVVPTGAWSF